MVTPLGITSFKYKVGQPLVCQSDDDLVFGAIVDTISVGKLMMYIVNWSDKEENTVQSETLVDQMYELYLLVKDNHET